MKLSSNIIRFYRAFGIKGTIDVFAKTGVEGIDFNNDLKEFYTDEQDKNFYFDIKNYAQDKGVKICQAHAPFARSGKIADVDDTPVAVFDHTRQYRPRAIYHAHHVDIDKSLPLLHARVAEVLIKPPNRSVVDKNIDFAKFLDCPFYTLVDRSLARHVAGQKQRLAAVRL